MCNFINVAKLPKPLKQTILTVKKFFGMFIRTFKIGNDVQDMLRWMCEIKINKKSQVKLLEFGI